MPSRACYKIDTEQTASLWELRGPGCLAVLGHDQAISLADGCGRAAVESGEN